MRKLCIAVVAVAAATLWAMPIARAQDIIGLSLRATDALPGETGRGAVDIVKSQGEGNYRVKVDLSGASEGLDLAKFEGATAWVVWAVDMEGVRHNVGALNDQLLLEDAAIDYLVARVYVTAEKDANAKTPEGQPLFSVTLRNVEEVDTLPEAPAAVASSTTGAPAGAPAASTGAAAPKPGDTVAKETQKPADLPKTGSWVQDVLVVLLVGAALLVAGSRLRGMRL